jgi:hypothetical protein
MGFNPFTRGRAEKPNGTLICLFDIEEGRAEPTEGSAILICRPPEEMWTVRPLFRIRKGISILG